MKKGTILAVGLIGLLMAGGLVFVSCGGGGGDDGDDNTGGGAGITYTAVADGTADTATSTKITFTFSEAVTGLEASNITITAGTGEATKGALTGSEKAWDLAISGVEQGKVKVKITKDGIDATAQDVDVYKVPDKKLAELGEEDLPSDGGVTGKGALDSDFVAKLNAVKPGSYIILYGTNAPGSKWGFGKITDGAGTEALSQLETPSGTAEGDDFELKVLVAEIKYALDILDYDEDTKHANGTLTGVGFNLYNGVELTKIALFEVDKGEDPPPPEPVVLPPMIGNLGDFTWINGETQMGWEAGKGDLVWTDVQDAKYLVLKTNFNNAYGLGGVQFVFQGDFDGSGSTWNQKAFHGWTDNDDYLKSGDADPAIVFYYVIDLPTALASGVGTNSTWTDFIGGTTGKFLIGGADVLNPMYGAWLLPTGTTLTIPTAAVEVSTGVNVVRSADWENSLEGDE